MLQIRGPKNSVTSCYTANGDNSADRNIGRVLSITDKSEGVPKSISLDSFAGNGDPSILSKLAYVKNGDEGTLSITLQKLMDLDISSNCHLYISMMLLPEAKKTLKQQTPKGITSCSLHLMLSTTIND